jgi:phage-related protein
MAKASDDSREKVNAWGKRITDVTVAAIQVYNRVGLAAKTAGTETTMSVVGMYNRLQLAARNATMATIAMHNRVGLAARNAVSSAVAEYNKLGTKRVRAPIVDSIRSPQLPTVGKKDSKGGGESKGGLLTAGAAGAVAGLAVGAVVQGARALADYGSQALETANQIKALSATTGASGQAIQIWTAIAKNSGAGPDAVKGSFKGLAAAVDGANNGNKEFTALFQQLGVSIKDAEGKTRPMGTLLREVGGALGEIEDPAKRAVATQKLLSEAGLQLAPAFEGGGQAVDALVGKFSTLGVTMSGPTIEKLAAVDQKVKDLKAGFGKIGPEMLVAFAPMIDVISSTLLPLLPMIAQQIAPIVQQLAEGLGPVIQSVLPLFGDMLKELMPVFAALIPVVVQVATVLVSALGPVLQGIVPVLSQVMQAILPLVPTLLNALLPAFLALVPAIVTLAVALVPLVEQLMPILVQLVTDLTPIITMLANILTALLVPAIDIISSATAMWIAGLSVLGSTLTIAINAVKLLWAVFTGNGEAMAAASGALDTAFADWWSAITGFGDKILGYFTAIWDGVKSGLSGALAAVGIGTGSVSVEAVASGASRAAVANAPTANVNSTTNQSTTLTDRRNINISVSGAPTPSAVAGAVSSSLDNVFTSDRSRTMASVAPAG